MIIIHVIDQLVINQKNSKQGHWWWNGVGV